MDIRIYSDNTREQLCPSKNNIVSQTGVKHKLPLSS